MMLREPLLLSCAFGILSLLTGGCVTVPYSSYDPLNLVDHQEKVEHYENRGVSHKAAERAVFEDDFFDSMSQRAQAN